MGFDGEAPRRGLDPKLISYASRLACECLLFLPCADVLDDGVGEGNVVRLVLKRKFCCIAFCCGESTAF